MTDTAERTCSECGQLACWQHEKPRPDFCLTEATDPASLARTIADYRGDELDGRMARAAAEVEGRYDCKLTRVEETLAFARRIGAHRIGIATCVGLIEETRIFARIATRGGFEAVTVLCKIGATDKTEIGVPEETKIRPGGYEACCNPILQAMTLNERKTDLNVIIGLCVGHDALFTRHSRAPVTTLVVKDRVLGHNPAVALYTSKSYMKRVLDEERLKGL